MLRSLLAASVLCFLCSCKSTPRETVQLGPVTAEHWPETDAAGSLLHCYLLGKESNGPVRICGDGGPAPDRKSYLLEAAMPKPGRFTEDVGPPLPAGWHLLRAISANKADAWSLGRLGDHQWLGNGKALLGINTDKRGTSTVRLLDPEARVERSFDVPLATSEGYVTVVAPDEAGLLLIQKVGVDLLILVRSPLTNPSVETLIVPNANSPGARKLWARGKEARTHHRPFRCDAILTSNITWKRDEPYFEDARLGPFTPLDETPQ
jgi:hypothetical protein